MGEQDTMPVPWRLLRTNTRHKPVDFCLAVDACAEDKLWNCIITIPAWAFHPGNCCQRVRSAVTGFMQREYTAPWWTNGAMARQLAVKLISTYYICIYEMTGIITHQDFKEQLSSWDDFGIRVRINQKVEFSLSEQFSSRDKFSIWIWINKIWI